MCACTAAATDDQPRASQSEELQEIFSVIVPVNGPTLVNGESADSDALLIQRAKEALARDPETRAVINADAAVQHGRVIHTLDLLKSVTSEEARERVTVYMEGLAQMRNDWARRDKRRSKRSG